MKNTIIKMVMIIDIICMVMGFCAIEKYANLFSVLFTAFTILIFAWFILINQNYIQKKVDRMLGRQYKENGGNE